MDQGVIRINAQEIKTLSYIHADGQLVCTDDLDAEQRVRLGTWLKTVWLNQLFSGQAIFRPLDKK